VINLGQNGGSQDGYTTLLNDLLAATPTTTLIAAMLPFTGVQAANIQAAIATCIAPARVKYIDTTGWWNPSDSSDGVHPYGDQNTLELTNYVAGACRSLLQRGATYLAGTSNASDKLITPIRI
jgi:hypothetical protein